MKRLLLVFALIMTAPLVIAAQTTRPINLFWTASTSTSVTGYSIYACASTTSTACVPSTTGTPALTATATSTAAVYSGTIGSYYSFVIVANAPACSGTSSITSPCGNSAPATFAPNPIPVPPQVAGTSGNGSTVP